MTLLDDLAAEHDALDAVLGGLSFSDWDTRTPGGVWRVRDQVGHIAYFDEMGTLAAHDGAAFEAKRDRDVADMAAFELEAQRIGREQTADDLLTTWRSRRHEMLSALGDVPDGARLPWYGPPMSVRSFATARLMETWAHGQDVVDGLGLGPDARPPSDRLRHIAFLGCATRGWSYAVRDRTPPDAPVGVELELPGGERFVSGEGDARDRIRGAALDFCLVVTQRRNVADTALEVEGDAAAEWMAIAQCFAGGATLPPAPGTRV